MLPEKQKTPHVRGVRSSSPLPDSNRRPLPYHGRNQGDQESSGVVRKRTKRLHLAGILVRPGLLRSTRDDNLADAELTRSAWRTSW